MGETKKGTIEDEMDNLISDKETDKTSLILREMSNSIHLRVTRFISLILNYFSKLLFLVSTVSFLSKYMSYSFPYSKLIIILSGFSLAIFIFIFSKMLSFYVWSKAASKLNLSK